MEALTFLFLALLFVFSSPMVFPAVASSNFTDQSSLLSIRSELQFDPILNSSWTKKTNFCNWIGVICSRRRQRITALRLPNMGISGSLSSHVGNLSFLVALDLANNSFHGRLPNELGRLHRLKALILEVNQFEGVIPRSLQHCQKLETISLRYNRLTGGIPEELGYLAKLQTLHLGTNPLGGSIPGSLANISTLKDLRLTQNSLTGSFPLVIFNMSSILIVDIENNSVSGFLPADICLRSPKLLQVLYLRNNRFGGEIPSSIYQCRALRWLSLSGNGFYGRIPKELGSLQLLQNLYLANNNFNGTIPSSLGNCSSLKDVSLMRNNIHGLIPDELGYLSNLEILNLQHNFLSGEIPRSIFNSSTLRILALLNNSLSGQFPPYPQFWLPNLERVLLAMNQLSGSFPAYISNCSKLLMLDFSLNLLSGPVPISLGDLPNLQFLSFFSNQLTGDPGSHELTFLTALTKCRLLQKLSIDYNRLDGFIPYSIGNFSKALQIFLAPGNQLKGTIPESIGFLENLNFLNLENNNLSGTIPSTIGGLRSLQKLSLWRNQLEGSIPDELCLLRDLGGLSLSNNKLSGSIPNCIGSLSRLQLLYLDSNSLSSSIPVSLWTLQNLLFLNLSFNAFTGSLPLEMKMLNVMEQMDLSWNQISGSIPTTFGSFTSLNYLNLSRNNFQGPLSPLLGNIRVLEVLDLSFNNLSGTIPLSFQELRNLKFLNLSFNKLSGKIPNGGPFANFSTKSFLSNEGLCGLPLEPCSSHQKSTTKQILLKYVLPAIAFVLAFGVLCFMLNRYKKRIPETPNSIDPFPRLEHRMISYEELRRATNNFDEANLLGVGSFGSVYRGTLSDGTIIATKVLNSQLEAAFKSFDVECKVLRTALHNNLVKIITSCSNPEFRALIMEYMSNGSLEKWLHSDDHCLNLEQRTSILVDVAVALEYLHHGQSDPIVHCDLKPSNVLLDEDMVAHVGDFGIAKILSTNKDGTQTKTLGTIGYIAPEFGTEGRVSTRADTYSYGILLLETITKRKPTDEMFVGELNLKQWVMASLPYCLEGVVDVALLTWQEEKGRDFGKIHNCLLSMLELGLECCKDSPDERMDMKDIVGKLNKIRIELVRPTRI